MQPAINPTTILPTGLKNRDAEAPIETPPAKEAFNICYILNCYPKNADKINVPIQLPVSEMTVLNTITDF